MNEKTCCNCSETKSTDDFYNNKYCNICIPLIREQHKSEEKLCTSCDTIKNINNFYKNNCYIDGVLPTCKDCMRKGKYKKLELEEFTPSIYINFVKEHIVISNDAADFFTPTYLFPLFKKYCREKCKYPHTQFKFKEDMSATYLLGPLISSYWVHIKYVNKK